MKPILPASFVLRPVAALVLGVSFAAFAQGPAPAPSQPAAAAPLTPPPSATTPGAPASAPAQAPSAVRPFKDVIKDAKETPGFFTLYEKDEKAWIEIKPDQFDKPFYFSTVRTNGVGERMVIAGLMGARHVVYFKKVQRHVQLLAQNHRFRAREGSASSARCARASPTACSPPAPVASQPHPDSRRSWSK
jgi:hypothetical protein